MIKLAIPTALFLLLSHFVTAQLPGQTLADATAALDNARPTKAWQMLNQLPKEQWKLVHKELALQIHYTTRAYKKVLSYGNELAEMYDLGSSAQLLMVKSGIKMNQLNTANERLEAIYSRIDPDEYQLVRGMIAVQTEDFEVATQHFEAAIAINPENPIAWTLRGQVLEKSGFLKRAEQAHQFALDLNPHCQEAHLGLARVHLLQKDVNSAIAAYKQGLIMNPEAKTLLVEGSLLALDLGKYELARAICQQAIQVFPKDAVFYANLGMSYFFVQDYDSAQGLLQKATRLRNDGADHYFLGLASIRSRRMQQAHQHLEMALSLGFEREDLPQLVEHCRSILASFDEEDNALDIKRF